MNDKRVGMGFPHRGIYNFSFRVVFKLVDETRSYQNDRIETLKRRLMQFLSRRRYKIVKVSRTKTFYDGDGNGFASIVFFVMNKNAFTGKTFLFDGDAMQDFSEEFERRFNFSKPVSPKQEEIKVVPPQDDGFLIKETRQYPVFNPKLARQSYAFATGALAGENLRFNSLFPKLERREDYEMIAEKALEKLKEFAKCKTAW